MTDGAAATSPSPRTIVVVSYFRDTSEYPRGGRPSRQGDLYWANIAVNAATLRHVAGPDVEFVVCAGDTPPRRAADVLADAGAQIRAVPFAHRPPDGFARRYVGSLYLLDTLPEIAGEVADEDTVMFVDPDIVWARHPGPLVEEIRRGGIVGYELRVPPTLPMCELTRDQQGQIFGEVTGRRVTEPPTHFGGEFYGILGRELPGLLPRLDEWWAATLRRHERGQPHFNVEEHVFNALMWERGEQCGRADPYLQRVRTLPHPLSTRDRVHDDLVAWHLPYEKDRGFPRTLRHLAAGRPVPAPGPGYQRWLRRRMGVEPTPARWAVDRARQVAWWLRRRQSGPGTPYGL